MEVMEMRNLSGCEEERKAYHEARRAQAKSQAKAEPKKQLTKAGTREA